MDKDSVASQPPAAERLKALEPPTSSHISIVLNGAFNGMTIGSVPSVVHALAQKVKKNGTPPEKLGAANIFCIVAGTAVGAWFGAREASHLRNYQNAVNEEIRKLRADVDAQAQQKEAAAR